MCDAVLSPVVAWRVLECLCVKPSGGCVVSVSVSVLSPVVAVLGLGSDPVLSSVVACCVRECLCAQWWLGGSLSVSLLSPVVACCVRECLCVKPSGGCVGSRK